jgi:transposase InsO family protein
VKYAFILAREVAFPVAVMCAVLGVSRSGYYGWRACPVSKRQERDAVKLKHVEAVFTASRGTYGSPRVHAELSAIGRAMSRRKVAELMQARGLIARAKKRFRATTDSKHDDPIAANLVARNFTSSSKNTTWVTDVTAIWTASGWLFLAAMLDLFSRRVVGWATSATNDRFLALDGLRDAIQKRRPGRGLVHHSDRGSPYASEDYRAELDRFGMIRSMSRKGDCWDNAVAESFFSTLKTELIGDSIPRSFDAATVAIGEYIEHFYNARRRHSSIGYASPIEYELKSQIVSAAA